MYILIYYGEPVSVDPPNNTKMATYASAAGAWSVAEARANRFGVSLDNYEVAKLVKMQKVTRTIVTFVESE